MQVRSLDFPCLAWGMSMLPVFKMLSFYLIISSTQPLLWASLQDKQSTMNERFFLTPSLSQQIGTFFALTRLFFPLWQEPQDHTCGTDQSKIRNMHRRAELHCTQAALGLFTESHGCREGGGLVSVKNSFLFWNCNARVHSSLGHALHRETAELVWPCMRQRDAGHNPPPLHC